MHTISHFMSWLNYKDSMLNSLSLGDAFPPIVMLLWQRGSTRRGQVWINAKGLIFYHRKVKEIIKADQLKEEGREVQ